MKRIEERARLAAWQIFEEIGLSQHSVDRVSEIITEKMLDQKAVDIDKASDLKEMPSLAELGGVRKCANYVLGEIGDISTMTKNEIVNAIVGKVFEYSKKDKHEMD